MIKDNPRKEDVDKAMEFMRQRLEAENSMDYHLELELARSAERIIDLAYKANIPPSLFSFNFDQRLNTSINEEIWRLRDVIDSYTDTLAVADHKEDEDDIIAYIHRDSFGKDFSHREREYTDRFSKELEVTIAAGLALGVAKDLVMKTVFDNRKNPYTNPIIREAVKRNYPVITRLDATVSYGIGRTVSSWTALNDLTLFAISEGWMHYFIEKEARNGAIGFISRRGSRYPCQQCDDETTYVHKLSDPLPPYHLHCKCYVIPIYSL